MVVIKESKVYAYVNSFKPNEYWNYSVYDINYGELDNYQLIANIGNGKYSEVFAGINLQNQTKCAIKRLVPVKKFRMQREIKILENLRNGPNIIKLLDVVKSLDNPMGPVSLIFEYFRNSDSNYKSFTINEIRYFIYELLRALDYCHSMGIIHRDIKPENIIFNRHTKQLRLIDFGMAEFYVPHHEYCVKVGTRSYKAPEILIDYPYYNYSVDLWSVGCIFGAMIFKKRLLFDSNNNNNEQLFAIVRTLGSEHFYDYVRKYQIMLKEDFLNILYQRKSWTRFINSKNRHLVSEQSLDLLNDFLCFDHIKRITALKAIHHPFFAPLIANNKN